VSSFIYICKHLCLRYSLTQVQLRLPQNLIDEIDKRVQAGEFKSRSDAIKAMVIIYQEREKTREFLKMLKIRSREAEDNPENLIPLEE
jgi:Arc/MetJ-type ribon-helix-helix transcriptional regulator